MDHLIFLKQFEYTVQTRYWSLYLCRLQKKTTIVFQNKGIVKVISLNTRVVKTFIPITIIQFIVVAINWIFFSYQLLFLKLNIYNYLIQPSANSLSILLLMPDCINLLLSNLLISIFLISLSNGI